MHKVYLIIILFLGVYILLHSRWFRTVRRVLSEWDFGARKEQLTMFDVRRLLMKGEKDLAIRIYCQLFKTDLDEAAKAVDEIGRSIQPKDF